MSYYDLDDLEHDPKLAEALGNMVVAWASAETALCNIFACIANLHINFAMMAYYRIPTFEARSKVVQSMLSEWETKTYDPATISDAVAKLSKLAGTRNDWIHGVWCGDKAKRETVVFDFRAPLDSDRRSKPVKAADVSNHVNAVRLRAETLRDLVPYPFEPQSSRRRRSRPATAAL
jgi:hypothetical protein